VFIGILPSIFFRLHRCWCSAFHEDQPAAGFLGVSVSSAPFLPVLIPLAVATGKLFVPASWTGAFSHLRYSFLVKWGLTGFRQHHPRICFCRHLLGNKLSVFSRLKNRPLKKNHDD